MTNFSRRDILKLGGIVPLSLAMPYFLGKPRTNLSSTNKQNILIVVFDTLSAKNMEMYGYPRATMPALSRIAQRATVYHNHYASGPFTTPGTASILTGVYPWTHRAFRVQAETAKSYENRNIFELFDDYYRIGYTHNPVANTLLRQFAGSMEEFIKRQELYILDDVLVSKLLAEDFDTAWFSRRQIYKKNEYFSNSLFLPRILRSIDDNNIEKKEARRKYGKQFPRGIPRFGLDNYFLLEDGINWMVDQIPQYQQPFLGYFHFYPPHRPYHTRREFVDVFKNDGYVPLKKPKHLFARHSNKSINISRREYDEFIIYVDAEFDRLYQFLDAKGILDNTWLVFTSDHGELLERGLHGHVYEPLHEPVIKVPLMIIEPGQRERKDIYSNTSCVDLLPTFLKIAGKGRPDWLEGEVLPPYRETPLDLDRAIYSMQARGNGKYAPLTKASVMMIKGDHKVHKYFGYKKIQSERDGEPLIEVYDIHNDPEELENLVAKNKTLTKDLIVELDNKIKEVNEPYL